MLIVLDSNEYIFAFGNEPKSFSAGLFNSLAQHPNRHPIRIPRTTVDDVRRHVSGIGFRDFLSFLRVMDILIDEDEMVPYEFGGKYLARGLKPGDAFLAGYTDWVGAQCLISENHKDFIDHPDLFPFQVLTAEAFLAKHCR